MALPVHNSSTLHLVPEPVWREQRLNVLYRPEGFDREGFIHCTDGDANLIAVGNRYYQADPREFLALTVDLSNVSARTTYEDEARIFPHIYGPLETAAVVETRRLLRSSDGTFLSMSQERTD